MKRDKERDEANVGREPNEDEARVCYGCKQQAKLRTQTVWTDG